MDRKIFTLYFPEALIDTDDEYEQAEELLSGPASTLAEIAHLKGACYQTRNPFLSGNHEPGDSQFL
jgi:hypothetical protein